MTLPIPHTALTQHVVALGKTGSGKSSKLRVLVEEQLHQDIPVIIVDAKGDWWGLKSSADGKREGFPIVIFGGERADVAISEVSGAHVAELLATGNRSALIDLGGWMVGERTRFFVEFASTLFKLMKGARTLVLPEVHNFAPQGKVMDPMAGKMLHWANRLASEGRGKGLTIFADSQRPQKVHKDFLTSCETLIACRVIHKLDRDAIKDWIDGCADAVAGKRVLSELSQMKRTDAWVWSPEIEFGPERITWPMFKTFDSFKPQSADAGKLKGWADVDLDEVRAKLVTVVQEAEANDPKTLKTRIAELEKQLAKPKDMAIDVEALKRADAGGYERAITHMQNAINEGAQVLAGHVKTMVLNGALREREKAPMTTISLEPSRTRIPTQRIPTDKQHNNGITMAKQGHKNAASSDLPAPQQKILDQLAWLENHGITPAPKETLAAVCGVSPTSGSYANNLGKLRSGGLIDYPSGGFVAFTERGRGSANPVVDDGRHVHEHWLDIVTEPQRKILQALIKAHPREVTKDDLAERIGVSSTSGSYANNLGRLRTLGAIDYPSRGTAALTKYVMP